MAAELAKRALGGESQVALSIKELAAFSPMMGEELISVIWESASLKADGNHISFVVRLGVLCPLEYVQMCSGDHQVWAMIDSGSMVNLLPTDLVRDATWSVDQPTSGCAELAGTSVRLTGWWGVSEVILGRPFLFTFQAGVELL
ncbi:hypothetical protein VP01_11253g1 [Puccinia sorghi]|uniref:Uncharacterized protein n=1 Tax=Puccinia sorghi TaxID=27349 RepID=A0A0L6VSB1_9BASI|nr:hypothetical protein VP01_11253g1 [Puccinia sorghi]